VVQPSWLPEQIAPALPSTYCEVRVDEFWPAEIAPGTPALAFSDDDNS
jgi:hypothetical protein